MTTFTIYADVTFKYEVEADTADEAAQAVEDGDGGHHDVVDATITKVVTASRDEGDWLGDAEDERSPRMCSGGCGKALPPGSWKCLDCLLNRPVVTP